MKNRNSLHIFEIFITILQLVILITAITFQAIPCIRCILLPLNDTIAGIFVQVDATVLALSIALISIMSGVLSDSYMGISYSDYYLNIRPRIYTQLTIIVTSLLYFLLACIFYWFNFHYLVTAFLFCEILLILMSAFSIYGIFGGKENIKKEIEEYSIIQQTRSGKGRRKHKKDAGEKRKIKEETDRRQKNSAVDIQDKFIGAFSKSLANGRKDEFVDYVRVLRQIISFVWEHRNEKESAYPLKKFEEDCNKLLAFCADSSNNEAKIFYLRLLACIYEQLFFLIRDRAGEGQSDAPHSFNILTFYAFVNEIVRKIAISELEDTITLSELFFRVQLVDLVLYNDYERRTENVGAEKDDRKSGLGFWVPNATVINLQAILGQYISEQKRKGNLPTVGYWIQEFYRWRGIDNIYYLDEDSRAWFKKGIANAGIVYTCGLLSQGQFDIVKRGLYAGRLEELYNLSDAELKIVLSVHAFLYYMAYCEDEKAVGSELQQRAKEFIEDPQISSSFRRIFHQTKLAGVLIKNLRSEWQFNDEVRFRDIQSREINTVLQRFDFRMSGHGMQMLIMSEAIDEFCLFMIFELYSHGMAGLEWLGDAAHNIEEFTQYISEGNDVEDRIKRFVFFLNADILVGKGTDSQEYKDCVSHSYKLYDTLQTAIRDRYKEKRIKAAREKEAEYLRQHDEIEDKRAVWYNDILKALHDKFGTMIDMAPADDVTYHDVILLEYSTYTDMIDGRMDETCISRIIARLIDGYIQLAKEEGCIELRNKEKELSDDQNYINLLRDNELKVMLGSEYLLNNMDYRKSEVFKEATKDSKWIKSLGGFYGAAVKEGSLVFYLKNLNVVIRPQTIEDEYYSRENSGEYTYEPVQGVGLQFGEEELSEFLGQERKIIEVTAKIGVKVYNQKAGIYFQNKRRPVVY